MKISPVAPDTNFTGYVDQSLREYIDSQRSRIVNNEARRCNKENYNECILNIDRINRKVSILKEKLNAKASKMHKNTCIYTKNLDEGIEEGLNNYWLYIKNDALGTKRSIRPQGEIKNSKIHRNLASWEVERHYSDENDLTPAEVLGRLEDLAEAIDPKKCDEAVLEAERIRITSKLNSAISERGDKKIAHKTSYELKKEAKKYERVKAEVNGKKPPKKGSFYEYILNTIKAANKSK